MIQNMIQIKLKLMLGQITQLKMMRNKKYKTLYAASIKGLLFNATKTVFQIYTPQIFNIQKNVIRIITFRNQLDYRDQTHAAI